MLRVLSVIFCVLILCVSLCACGAKEEVEELATEAMSEIADTENATVSDDDGFIGNESDNNTTDSDTNNSATDSATDSTGEQTEDNNGNERMYDNGDNTGMQNDSDIFM